MGGKDEGISAGVAAAAGFAVGSVVTAAVAYYAVGSARTSKEIEFTNPTKADAKSRSATRTATLPPEIRSEQLSRNTLYFGDKGMASITNSRVAVIGLGGVGSHCAHMLARSGVRYLRLVDFDQVTVSSLNRHACATLDDVGIPKVVALQRYLEKICPDRSCMEIDARVQMYTGDPAKDGDLMEGDWDLIIDAIDDVPTKANLIAHCVRDGIRVVSCMGAGGKSDVTRLHVSDLRSASRDPLASKLRQCLKRQLRKDDTIKDDSCMDDPDRIAVVYSSEKTVVKLADFTEEQKEEGVHKFGAVDNMRIRVLPVLGTMPAIMGQSCAAVALCELGDKPFSPVAGERIGRSVRNRLFQHLKRREKALRDSLEPAEKSVNGIVEKKESAADGPPESEGKSKKGVNPNDDFRPACMIGGKWFGPVQIDSDDVEYLLAEIWRNRCAVNGDRLGTVLELVRWDVAKPSDCTNLVLMGVKALQKFDKDAKEGDGRDSVPQDVRRKIEARLATCRVDDNA